MDIGEQPTLIARQPVDPTSIEDLPPGLVVAEYLIEKKLGRGGFGSVYRAKHPLIGKNAAIKVLHHMYSANAPVVARFVAEARAVNQIHNENIVDIFGFGQLPDGRHYYVMELLEGESFSDYLNRAGPIDIHQALGILRPIGRALDAAHQKGIVHRDIKPDNIFIAISEDNTPIPKLLDFGIAKFAQLDRPSKDFTSNSPEASGMKSADTIREQIHRTQTGMQIGTPWYMSPEQCRGIGVDHRTDIYAFGVLLYRVLTGRLPFESDSALDVMMKHVRDSPAPLSSLIDMPIALDAPVLQMLAKDPADRPPTLKAALDALEDATVTHTARVDPQISTVIEPKKADSQPAGSAKPGSTFSPRTARWMVPVVATIGLAIVYLTISQFLKRPSNVLAISPVAASAAYTPSIVREEVLPPAKTVEMVASSAHSASPMKPTLHLIAVRFELIPANAEILLGEHKLGFAPGPFALAEGLAKMRLQATGYVPKDVELVVKDGLVVRESLVPVKKKFHGDLEAE